MKKYLSLIALGLAAFSFSSKRNTTTPTGTGTPPTGGGTGMANESFLNNSNFPRGLRNNNPGNIKRGSSPWQGKVPHGDNTDSVFEQFHEYRYGVRAFIVLLKNYMEKYDLHSVHSIIGRWAPPGVDNNPDTAYSNYVANRMGVGVHDHIDFNYQTMKSMVQAMAFFENAREAVLDYQFNNGWQIV